MVVAGVNFTTKLYHLQDQILLGRGQHKVPKAQHLPFRYIMKPLKIVDGEPRFELLKEGEIVDTVRVGRYDIAALRRLMKEFGL